MTADSEQKAPRLYRVIVPVGDLERAVEFYTLALGMEGKQVADNRHYFDCGGTILAVVDTTQGGTRDFSGPNPDHIYFAVHDLEAAFDRAMLAGCAWLEEQISTRPWDERSFYARDPFGNPICFVDENTIFTGQRYVP